MTVNEPLRRFVVLRHEPGEASHRPLHWDFMLEDAAALRTWALAAEPVIGEPIPAEPLAAHRQAYLDFAGPISGGRGSVTQWDSGTYRLIEQSADRLQVELSGRRLRGMATLTRADAAAAHWVFRFSSGRDATSG